MKWKTYLIVSFSPRVTSQYLERSLQSVQVLAVVWKDDRVDQLLLVKLVHGDIGVVKLLGNGRVGRQRDRGQRLLNQLLARHLR